VQEKESSGLLTVVEDGNNFIAQCGDQPGSTVLNSILSNTKAFICATTQI
jgi:hypothetical protein